MDEELWLGPGILENDDKGGTEVILVLEVILGGVVGLWLDSSPRSDSRCTAMLHSGASPS